MSKADGIYEPQSLRHPSDPMTGTIFCLVEGCDRPIVPDQGKRGARGLCSSCYQTAWLLVKAGRTTWDELEQHGKVKERMYPDRYTRGKRIRTLGWFLGRSK